MKAPSKVSRMHKTARGTFAYYLCVNCSLLETDDFWRAFINHLIKRQINRRVSIEETD
jgi:hypothetical protein